ncbi:MAG: hypothetical protein V3S69_07280 [Dehalococcoidales bacterium]
MKQKVLDRLNTIIVEEKGCAVTMKDKLVDSNLDSLGTIITIATLESEYPFFAHLPKDADALQTLDIPNLTVRDLIKKCILSTTNPSQEPKTAEM